MSSTAAACLIASCHCAALIDAGRRAGALTGILPAATLYMASPRPPEARFRQRKKISAPREERRDGVPAEDTGYRRAVSALPSPQHANTISRLMPDFA